MTPAGALDQAVALCASTSDGHLTVAGLSDWIGSTLMCLHGEVNEDSDEPVEVCAPVADDVDTDHATRIEPAHREAVETEVVGDPPAHGRQRTRRDRAATTTPNGPPSPRARGQALILWSRGIGCPGW